MEHHFWVSDRSTRSPLQESLVEPPQSRSHNRWDPKGCGGVRHQLPPSCCSWIVHLPCPITDTLSLLVRIRIIVRAVLQRLGKPSHLIFPGLVPNWPPHGLRLLQLWNRQLATGVAWSPPLRIILEYSLLAEFFLVNRFWHSTAARPITLQPEYDRSRGYHRRLKNELS